MKGEVFMSVKINGFKTIFFCLCLTVCYQAVFAENDHSCSVNILKGYTYKLPVYSDTTGQIEGINLTIDYNSDIFQFQKARLSGGILEKKDDIDYGINIKNTTDGVINIALPAFGGLTEEKGNVVFLYFNPIGNELRSSEFSLSQFMVNENPGFGGFNIDSSAMCTHLQIDIQDVCDLNNRIGLEDVLFILTMLSDNQMAQQTSCPASIENAILVLQYLAGMK